MYVRTTRQSKANSTVKDTFYWPDMTRKDVSRNVDMQGLPTANQMYIIPEAFKLNPLNYHNRGLYSLWAHFVEFCVHNSHYLARRFGDISSEPFFQISSYQENPHVPGAKRLDIFITLSMGRSYSSEKKLLLTSVVDRATPSSQVSKIEKKYGTLGNQTVEHQDTTLNQLIPSEESTERGEGNQENLNKMLPNTAVSDYSKPKYSSKPSYFQGKDSLRSKAGGLTIEVPEAEAVLDVSQDYQKQLSAISTNSFSGNSSFFGQFELSPQSFSLQTSTTDLYDQIDTGSFPTAISSDRGKGCLSSFAPSVNVLESPQNLSTPLFEDRNRFTNNHSLKSLNTRMVREYDFPAENDMGFPAVNEEHIQNCQLFDTFHGKTDPRLPLRIDSRKRDQNSDASGKIFP